MEGLAEQVISTYLTRGGKVFIAPQYSVQMLDSDREIACPDFVALDFEQKEVVIVEVTVASNTSKIITKIRDAHETWLHLLSEKLKNDGIIDDSWEMRILCFIRRSQVDKAKAKALDLSKVAFYPIEDATFSYDYWAERTGGLPR